MQNMNLGDPSSRDPARSDKRAESRRTILASLEEFRREIVAVTRLAERSLAIYATRLEPEIYAYPAFVEAVKRLVLARSFARVRILVAEAGAESDSDHPLAAIAARLPAMMEFRVMPAEQCDGSSFVVADEAAVVYRLHCTRWDGIAELYDPPVAKMYLGRFDRIWPNAAPLRIDASRQHHA